MGTALQTPHLVSPSGAVEALNRSCFCFSLDQEALARTLDSELGKPGLSAMVRERCPFLFSAQPVFVAPPHLLRMTAVMQAVETVVALPAYQDLVLAAAPAIARLETSGPLGVFFGYDFHLADGHLGLIEINTNAGGAMLNAVLARAQRACCTALDSMTPSLDSVAAFEQRIVDMFRNEWRLSGRTRPLASIAIVDEAPEDQYLYPEFLLFKQLFERHGMRSVVADPATLEWRGGVLWHAGLAIDLIYNRLTDFYLEQAASSALREAYLQHAVVLTPNPRTHALYADKRHLALFSDAIRLEALGVPQDTREILLEHVPHTEIVRAVDAQRLWDARRGLFFKPIAGFGSRAAYRGDKLTKRVWQDILAGDYVAQAILAPGERLVNGSATAEVAGAAGAVTGKDAKALKFDLRIYAYNSAVQWVAARLYQGQTTNFRTPGGGFAPVYSSADVSGRTLQVCAGNTEGGVADHASYVFLLDESSGVHPVPHGLYVALARGEASAPALAGLTLRLADWYVRLKDGEPDSVVNESYILVRFDAQGRVDWTRFNMSTGVQPAGSDVAEALENASLPSEAERAIMREALFAGAAPSRQMPVPPAGTALPH